MRSDQDEAEGLLEGTSSPSEFEKGKQETQSTPPKHVPQTHYTERYPQVELKKSKATRLVTFLLFAFVALDVAIYSYIAKQLLSEDYPEELEIANAYYGLDELYDPRWNLANSSHHDPIINLPRRLGMVDSLDPQKISPFEEHLTLTPYGRMSIPDHHLQVSDQVRTLSSYQPT